MYQTPWGRDIITCNHRASDKGSFTSPFFWLFFFFFYLAAPPRSQQALHLGSHLFPTNLARRPVTGTPWPPCPLLSTVQLAWEIPDWNTPPAWTVTQPVFTSLYYMLATGSMLTNGSVSKTAKKKKKHWTHCLHGLADPVFGLHLMIKNQGRSGGTI